MLNNMGLGFLFTAKDLASGVMGDVKKHMMEVEGESSRMGKIIGSNFAKLTTGLAIMGAGLAGLAMLEPAIAESKELSKAIALVATEADEAVFPQEKMRDVAEQLAVTYGKAPVEQANALYKAVALGANDAAKSVDFLNGVNLLAVAGNADLELSANALGGALNAYGASFSKATDYSDAFFVAMKNGNTTVQDLAASVGRVTSTASGLNISIDEILGAVSVMTNKGVQATEAVSGLKEALANVVHPSADARAEAARLGVKFTQTELRAKGLQGFLKEITSSSRFTANSFSKLFTSVEGSNAVMQVASGQMAAYNNVMDAMAHKQGATAKGFDIMSQTLDFQEKKFEANKKVALGMIGQALEPLAARILGAVNGALQLFAKIPKPIVAFIAKVFAGVSAFLVLVGGVIAAKAAFVLLLVGMKAAGITLGGMMLVMLPAIATIAQLAVLIYGLKVAFEQNLGGIRTFVWETWSKIKLVFQGLVQLFEQGGFSGAVRKEMNAAGNGGLKQFAITVFTWAKRIQHLFASVGEAFEGGMVAAQPAIRGMIDAFTRLGHAFGFLSKNEGPKKAMSTWQKMGEIGGRIGRGLVLVFEHIVGTVTHVVEFFTAFVEESKKGAPVFAVVTNALGNVGSAFSMIGDQLGFTTDATGKASSGWSAAGMVFSYIAQVIAVAIGLVVATIRVGIGAISGIFGSIKSLFSGIVDIFYGLAEIIDGIIHGDWAKVWHGFKMIVFGVVDAVIGIILELAGTVAGVADALAGMFGKDLGWQKSLQGLKDSVHNGLGSDMGVIKETGYRTTHQQTANPVGAPTMLPMDAPGAQPLPLASLPPMAMPAATAAAGAGAPPDMNGLHSKLDEIATNTKQGASVNVTVVADGEVLARANARAKRGDDARGFNPLPSPT